MNCLYYMRDKLNKPASLLHFKGSVFLIGLLGLSFFTACASAPVAIPLQDESIIENVKPSLPELKSERFGEPIQIENEEQIYTLSTKQQQKFLDYFSASRHRDKPGHVKVYEYLQNIGLDFTYASKTNNASTTLQSQSGNCMSLAMLTTALARIADVDIEYQLVNRVPVYQEFGSVIFNAQHIRSVLYEPLAPVGQGVSLWRSKAIVDYYPSRYTYTDGNASSEQVLSMYYRNLAAEALGKDDYNRAFWLLKASLDVEPDNAHAINTLAVLHRRVGEEQVAEELYKYGIKHAQNKIPLLKNYQVLLEIQERHSEAQKIATELEGLDDLNPFRWLLSANESFDAGDYTTAYKLYLKSVDLAPYLHQGYLGIAKIEYHRKRFTAAREALEQAKENSFELKTRSIYEAKLAALSRERFN